MPQDASTLREVPDNQEVWVDTATDASLILECVELQTEVQVWCGANHGLHHSSRWRGGPPLLCDCSLSDTCASAARTQTAPPSS